eukprot:2683407-Heterocapsa_arctica.AAC.1
MRIPPREKSNRRGSTSGLEAPHKWWTWGATRIRRIPHNPSGRGSQGLHGWRSCVPGRSQTAQI